MTTKKESDPAAYQLTEAVLRKLVARRRLKSAVGPAIGEAGEEAGASLKTLQIIMKWSTKYANKCEGVVILLGEQNHLGKGGNQLILVR